MTGFIDWLQHSTAGLLTLAALSIAVLLLAIIKLKLEPFIALIVVGLLTALAAGVPVGTLVGSAQKASDSLLEKGFGGILGHIAAIIGLGTLLGAILEKSGGAKVLTKRLLRAFGEKRRAARDGRGRADLRHPGVLRHRHLRAGAAGLRGRQAGRQVDHAVLRAVAGRAVGDARVPAAAPRSGGRGGAAAASTSAGSS